jgi:cytidyltransferase-like protein
MIIGTLQTVREFFSPRVAVLASGAFDPLHYGHIRYIRAAAQQARQHELPLVVAVAPDEYVKRKHPLLQPIAGRMEMLDALRGVDFVVPQGSESLAAAIREISPAYVVKGTDWKVHGLPPDEVNAIEEVGAKTTWVEVSPISSSELLQVAFWRFADEWVGRT